MAQKVKEGFKKGRRIKNKKLSINTKLSNEDLGFRGFRVYGLGLLRLSGLRLRFGIIMFHPYSIFY